MLRKISLFGDKSIGKHHFSSVDSYPYPANPLQSGYKSELFINMVNIFAPPWWFTETSPDEVCAWWNIFHQLFHTSNQTQLMLVNFSKNLSLVHKPKPLSLWPWCVPVPLAKLPQIWHEGCFVSTHTVAPIRQPLPDNKKQPALGKNIALIKWTQMWHKWQLALPHLIVPT